MRVLFPLVSDIADCFSRQNIKHFSTGLLDKYFIYNFIFILTTTYNLNERRRSIVMLLLTLFNGTLRIILNLVIMNIKFTNGPLNTASDLNLYDKQYAM